MLIFLQKAWTFIKTYWQYALLILGVIVGYFLFRGQTNDFTKRLKDIQDAHDEEIKRINDARSEERQKYLENERRYQETLTMIQQQYDIAKKNLDDTKKKEIETIVREHGSNPSELAKQLSEATGFTIIMPS